MSLEAIGAELGEGSFDGADAGSASGQMTPDDGFPSFVPGNWGRGEVSEHCRSSFQACGGLLVGTWQVQDNCNPVVTSPEVLQAWGRTRMSLDPAACAFAVKRLTWAWTGELKFENGDAIDNRERAETVDIAIEASCLSATSGRELESISPEACESLEDESTTCALASGVCMCTTRTVTKGSASGVYGVLGLSVAIAQEPTTRYEYCVEGDQLVWREKEGAQRHVVMQRIADAAPGDSDPVDIPSSIPR